MRLRSRGLGRKELVMDFREYAVVREGDEIVIVGTIREPVTWDFSIRVCEDDFPGIARVAVHRRMLRLLLRALFRRRKRHHWSQDRATHLTETKRRRAAVLEKAALRAAAGIDPSGARASRPSRTPDAAATQRS